MVSRSRRVSAAVSLALVAATAIGSIADADSPSIAPTVGEPGLDTLVPFSEPGDAPVPDLSIDRWVGVGGQSLGDVTPGALPTETIEQVGGFESPINVGNDYAVRLRTLLTPEVSGTYRLWVSGDDDMRLFMNTTGDDPAGAEQIAYIAGWTTFRQWNRFWSQRSMWVELEAGNSYYVEAIGKEGSGDDHFSVAWELADGFDREVVPARVLEATQLGSGGWRASTPTGLPGLPSAMTDPQWSAVSGPETVALDWASVDGAEWYEVRLEGSGEARHVTTDDSAVVFNGLVPDTRYYVEVAPASPAGRQREVGRVVVTAVGPYPAPVAAPEGDTPAVTYDHWDTGWWTLTSVPDGLAPESTTTLTTGLEVPPMRGDNHASRLRAVVTPERSDVYTFHLAGDDDARLLFNANGPHAHGAEVVAYVSGWTEQYQWARYQSQATQEYELVAGHSYYIEAMGVHGLGFDHLEVGWSTPGSPIEVVPADVLSPTMSGAGGWRQDADGLGVAPGPVTNVTDVWVTDTTATISWEPPTVTDEAGVAAHYVATVQGTEASQVVSEAAASFQNLVPGTSYTIEIVAANEIGTGPMVPHTVVNVVTTTTTTTTTAPTTTTTTAPTTTTATTDPTTTTTPDARLRLTFMCKAVDGGDITADDYLDRRDIYPAGTYVWRVRSENEIGPIAFETRVGGGTPFHTGTLQPNETQFFATDVGHQGASVHWDGGSKGTASSNESACGVNTPTSTTTTPTTTTTTPTTTPTTTTTTPTTTPTTTTPTTTTTTPTTTTTTTTTAPTTTTTTTTTTVAPVPDPTGERPLTAGYAILTLADVSCGNGLQLSGSSIDVIGGLRSNGSIMVQGSGIHVDGVISYSGSPNVGVGVDSDGVERDTTPVASNLEWTVADFADRSPLGSAVPYFRHQGYWSVSGSVERGIHYVDGNVQMSSSDLDLRGVTIVATGTIGISGSRLQLSPASPSLPTIMSGADSCWTTGVNLSASSIEWTGIIAAPDARVQVNGSNLQGGEILAGSVQLSGSSIVLGAGSCDGGCGASIVDSGDPVVYLTQAQTNAAKKAGKAVGKGLSS